MNIGQRVKINMPDTIWDKKEGVVESIEDTTCTVFVDFIPEEGKKIRQDFSLDNLEYSDYNNDSDEITEDLKLKENDMSKIIKEIDWNGNHYTFTNTFYRTGTKSHDVLTMEDQMGSKWTGETTWINRPWHRFDLEEAFTEIVSKAFGPKAVELIYKINSEAISVEQAIDKFFAQFKPEDIEANPTETNYASAEDRAKALAKYLEVDADIVTYNENNVGADEFEVDGETYRVLTDDEADEAFDDYCRNLWDEVGLDMGYLTDSLLEYAVDESELEDYVREDISNYVYDMSDEEVADECVNEGIVESEEVYDENSDAYTPELKDDVDFDDLREKLIESKFDEVDDYVEFLRDAGFDDEFFKNFIDEDKAVEVIKDAEDVTGGGRGALAYYDGAEIDLDNGLFAYRID